MAMLDIKHTTINQELMKADNGVEATWITRLLVLRPLKELPPDISRTAGTTTITTNNATTTIRPKEIGIHLKVGISANMSNNNAIRTSTIPVLDINLTTETNSDRANKSRSSHSRAKCNEIRSRRTIVR